MRRDSTASPAPTPSAISHPPATIPVWDIPPPRFPTLHCFLVQITKPCGGFSGVNPISHPSSTLFPPPPYPPQRNVGGPFPFTTYAPGIDERSHLPFISALTEVQFFFRIFSVCTSIRPYYTHYGLLFCLQPSRKTLLNHSRRGGGKCVGVVLGNNSPFRGGYLVTVEIIDMIILIPLNLPPPATPLHLLPRKFPISHPHITPHTPRTAPQERFRSYTTPPTTIPPPTQ